MKELVRPHGTIAYDDQGSGPLVVMAPRPGGPTAGVPLSGASLGRGRLPGRYRRPAWPRRLECEWPDYTSESAGADLLALIEELQAGPATVVGNSFGAAPAMWAAAENPEAFSRLVLMGPFVRDHEIPAHMRFLMRTLFSGPPGNARPQRRGGRGALASSGRSQPGGHGKQIFRLPRPGRRSPLDSRAAEG